MRIILVITVCHQNQARILHQINNLNVAFRDKLIPDGVDIVPIFVFGKNGSDPIKNPYKVLTVDVPERYVFLHRKLFEAYKAINSQYTYDFIWKIDDDTKVNFQSLNPEVLRCKDYVGRFFDGKLEAKIRLDLDFCNLHKDIHIKTDALNDKNFRYATGDSYFLSPRAIDWILQQKHVVDKCDDGYVAEDRMFGYMLSDKDLVTQDITVNNDFTESNELQVTHDYLTIHPISAFIFASLIGWPIEEQLKRIDGAQSINLLKRRIYTEELESKLKQTVVDFLNAKRSIGMG